MENTTRFHPSHGPQFPKQLWKAANANAGLIEWVDEGTAIVVDDEKFEKMVMDVHPGLVQIPSFANLRRQLRQYGFTWCVEEDCRTLKFSHPHFKKHRPDLIFKIVTRRKAVRMFCRKPTKTKQSASFRKYRKNKKQNSDHEVVVNKTEEIKCTEDIARSEKSFSYDSEGMSNQSSLMNVSYNQQDECQDKFSTYDSMSMTVLEDSENMPYSQEQDTTLNHMECVDFCPFALLGFVMSYWGNKCISGCTNPHHAEGLRHLFASRHCVHMDTCIPK